MVQTIRKQVPGISRVRSIWLPSMSRVRFVQNNNNLRAKKSVTDEIVCKLHGRIEKSNNLQNPFFWSPFRFCSRFCFSFLLSEGIETRISDSINEWRQSKAPPISSKGNDGVSFLYGISLSSNAQIVCKVRWIWAILSSDSIVLNPNLWWPEIGKR